MIKYRYNEMIQDRYEGRKVFLFTTLRPHTIYTV